MYKKNISTLVLIVMFICSFNQTNGQALYDVNSLQKIEVWFSQPNWDYQMDTAKAGADEYLMADWVKINGIQYDSVGVKYKGNSSYDSTLLKNPIHIAFDEFKDQKHQGYTDIKLSNGYGDPSHIREVISYSILSQYMHCPKANFAQLYINGNYIGIYSSAENIDKKFCADHFYSNSNTFIKCNPVISPSPAIKSNLKYINPDSSSYANLYEIKSKSGWNELVKLCDSVSNYQGQIASYMDLDRTIWMLGFNNLMVNLDSYSGVFAQNYYIYKDNTNHYNPIIWDLNMCMGAFPFAGAGTSSMGTLTTTNMQQFPISNHETDPNWPLLNAVISNASYKKMMVAHMRTILNEHFANNAYKAQTIQLQSIIDTAVQSETNGFFNYTQFQNASNTDYTFGSYAVPGLYNLMDARVSYLQSTSEFTATPPSITTVTPSATSPSYNSTVTITANVTNATSSTVTLGYRFDKTLKFEKVTMYDDGAHNDGNVNDNIFGASFTMSSGTMQYYIYAENATAAMFSPERAEHEFHTLYAASVEPNLGDIVINEVLADNANNKKDEYNTNEDWIELYNKTNQVLELSNIYLSNTYSNLSKWKFPIHTTINPNSYLMIWADDDSSQQILHTNFNLSKVVDTLYLTKANAILDSVSFSNQLSDISYGRYPNGSGSFVVMNTTYNGENNNFPLNTLSQVINDQFSVFPNPSNTQFKIQFEGKKMINIFSISGKKIMNLTGKNSLTVNTSSWPSGLYIVQCGNQYSKIAINHD